jgi:ParB-like chromosome segregation protein Spo0J
MINETDNLSYLDKKQNNDLTRLKQFQSKKSEIFVDRVLQKQDRLRYFYLNEIEIDRIKIDQKIVVRDKDPALLRRLGPQINAEGLIEPLTVEDLGNNQYLLLAGQHRYHVLRELGIENAPAKIYLELEPDERLTLGYMSNEARKDPPAGRKYGSLHEQFNEIKKKLKKEIKREPSEYEVINEMYMAKNPTNKDKLQKLKTKEILIAILLEQIKYEPDSLVNDYKFISDAQVPKTRITSIVDEFKKNNTLLELPLLTSKNAFYGLTHLVRTIPINLDDQKQGNDYRHLELQNVTAFLELLITKYIKPWMETGESAKIDASMNLCKRHIFETLCKLIANRLRDRDFDIVSKDGKKAPLFTDKKVPWKQLFDDLELFFNPDFLNHPNISQERSLGELWNRSEYYVITRPGRFPNF